MTASPSWANCRYSQRPPTSREGKLVPGPPVQFATARLGRESAPLLEEEGDARAEAPVADVPSPLRVHGAMPRPALPAHDDPANAGQVQAVQRANQGLAGEKPH